MNIFLKEKLASGSSDIWTKKSAIVESEKTIDDEFDEFIDDLFF